MANNMQPMWLHYLDYNHRVLKTHNSDFFLKKCKVLFFSLKTLNFEFFFNSDFFNSLSLKKKKPLILILIFFFIQTFFKKIWLFLNSEFLKKQHFF